MHASSQGFHAPLCHHLHSWWQQQTCPQALTQAVAEIFVAVALIQPFHSIILQAVGAQVQTHLLLYLDTQAVVAVAVSQPLNSRTLQSLVDLLVLDLDAQADDVAEVRV